MLVRARSRRLGLATLRDSQLYRGVASPRFTCYTSRVSSSLSSKPSRHPHSDQRDLLRTTVLSPGLRSLATAADTYHATQDGFPFESAYKANPWLPGSNYPPPVSFSPSTPGDLLIVPVDQNDVARRASMVVGLPGGNPLELHQNLYACLSIGRLERARALIRRICSIMPPGSPEIMDAHRLYLETLLDFASEGRNEVTLDTMRQWVKKEIVDNGIEPNANISILLVRAYLQLAGNEERDRLIMEALDTAKLYNHLDDTIASPQYTDEEFEYLVRLFPDLFPMGEGFPEDELAIPKIEPVSTEIKSDHAESTEAYIKPVNLKGLGLKSLTQSLEGLKTAPPQNNLTELLSSDLETLQHRQERIEETVVDAAVERWRIENENLKKRGVSRKLGKKSLAALMWQWFVALKPLIKEELGEIQKVLDHDDKAGGKTKKRTKFRDEASDRRRLYGPYLERFGPDKLAATTILSAIECVSAQGNSQGHRIGVVVRRITCYLEAVSYSKWLSKHSVSRSQKISHHKRRKLLSQLRKGGAEFVKQTLANGGHIDKSPEIPEKVRFMIGALLVEKLLKSAQIEVERNDLDGNTVKALLPAFAHTMVMDQGRLVGKILANTELEKLLVREPMRGSLGAQLPMVAPPKKWTGYKEGGFYRYPVPVMRSKRGDHLQRSYAQSAADNGDLDTIFAGLDVLGRTPWRINGDVFKVVVEAWNSGEAIAGLAPENPDMPVPPEPEDMTDLATRYRWLEEVKRIENKKSGYHSQRSFQNFQLEIAKAYLAETFYYPHNIDFRGRAYPVPPILNHMGADLSRGLLKFGVGKELGPDGLGWLKIQLANVYGYDKASLGDRQRFVTDNLAEVYDSATKPLDGRRWWLKAEDPWQCLAACIELRNALESPDPALYVSDIPVHQDGTCNGLQHYAALGGDAEGASQVNLEPSEKPQDVYTGVAEKVRAFVEEDAANGNPTALKVRDHITRKVVKRTVMTNVYGVTYVGARTQVLEVLDDIMPQTDRDAPFETSNFNCAAYIAKQIFKALSTMFSGAHHIQSWFGECARRISLSVSPHQIEFMKEKSAGAKRTKSGHLSVKNDDTKNSVTAVTFKTGVIWTTPLKLPVVQPYRNSVCSVVHASLQSLKILEPKVSDPVSKRKQLQGFPPNFVHSLDATHMILSALECDRKDLTFAAVHDSFWTHASTIAEMNTVLRDAFVRMHSEDIIGRLLAEFKTRCEGYLYLADIERDTVVFDKICRFRAKRRKSNTKKQLLPSDKTELFEEYNRQKLLSSENEKDRLLGQKIVTPASIFERYGAESQLAKSEDMPAPLGEVSEGPSQFDEARCLRDPDAFEVDAEATHGEAAAGEDNEAGAQAGLGLDMDVEGGDDNAAEAADIADSVPKKKKDYGQKLQIWLPISFPAVPSRGDFDVSRLQNSEYFFS